MSFPSDGRNHRNAIKNEHDTKEYLQGCAHLIYGDVEEGKYIVLSKGGTKNKADNIIECDDGRIISISDKQKKNGLYNHIYIAFICHIWKQVKSIQRNKYQVNFLCNYLLYPHPRIYCKT